MSQSRWPAFLLVAMIGCQQAAETPKPTSGGPTGLGIGQTAPEIEGKDQDGVAFKLSDYRGKVVFLDFWGDW